MATRLQASCACSPGSGQPPCRPTSGRLHKRPGSWARARPRRARWDLCGREASQAGACCMSSARVWAAVATARPPYAWRRAAWAAADKYPSESILRSMTCARKSREGGSVASAATVTAASATARGVKVCSSHSNSALIKRVRSDGTTAGALRRASASALNRSPTRGLDCQACCAAPVKLPAPACNNGTYSHEKVAPWRPLGGRASCHGRSAVWRAAGAVGEGGGVNPGVASPGAVGATSPPTASVPSQPLRSRGVAKVALSHCVSDTAHAADAGGSQMCRPATACNVRSCRVLAAPLHPGPGCEASPASCGVSRSCLRNRPLTTTRKSLASSLSCWRSAGCVQLLCSSVFRCQVESSKSCHQMSNNQTRGQVVCIAKLV